MTRTRHAHTPFRQQARMDMSILARQVTAPVIGADRSMDQWRQRRPCRSRGGPRRSRRDREARIRIPFPRIGSRAGRSRYFLRAPHRPVIAATIDGELAGYALVVAAQGRARGAHLFDRGRRALCPPRRRPRRCCRPARDMRADTGAPRSRSKCATTTRPPSRSTRNAAFASSASTRTTMPTARRRCATRRLSSVGLCLQSAVRPADPNANVDGASEPGPQVALAGEAA